MDMTIPPPPPDRAPSFPLDAMWDFARQHGYGDGESMLDDSNDVITDRFTRGRKGRGVGYVLQGTKLKGWF